MINKSLLEILACPICHSDLTIEDDKLICLNKLCKKEYPFFNGIPIMLPDTLINDLEITQVKWDEEYKNIDVSKIDLEDDKELCDAFSHVENIKGDTKGFFLEAGCGPSKLSCKFAKEGISTIGIDVSMNALLLSKKLFERENVDGIFVCGDILHMPFKGNCFSFIYTGGVIEHFKNTQQAVNEIYRCLDNGGRSTNTVPCLSLSTIYRIVRWGNIPDVFIVKNIIEFIEIKVLKMKRMRFGYEKSFSPNKMRCIFKKSGFNNIDINLFNTYYPLEIIESVKVKNLITKLSNHRLFWPMIYIAVKK